MQDGAHVAKRGLSIKSQKYERSANIIFSSISRRQIDQKWIDEQPARGDFWRDIAKSVHKSSRLKSRIGLFLMWKNNRGDICTLVSRKVNVATKQSWDTELTVATRKKRARKRLDDQFVNTDIFTGKAWKFDSLVACMVCLKRENEDRSGAKWISCSPCSGWFDFECIGIDGENAKIFEDKTVAKKIVFHCAMKSCSMNTFCCKYSHRGRTINIPINMMRSTHLEKSNEPSLKIDQETGFNRKRSTSYCLPSSP